MRTANRQHQLRPAVLALVLFLVVSLSVSGGYAGSAVSAESKGSSAAWGASKVSNGSFEARGRGWRSNGRLRFARGGSSGTRAELSTRGRRAARLWDTGRTVRGAKALSLWRATVRVRATRPGVRGHLIVMQRSGADVVTHAQRYRLSHRRWRRVSMKLLVTKGRANLDLALQTGRLRRSRLLVDDLKLQPLTTSRPQPDGGGSPGGAAGRRLTNGCTYSKRGVPSCGTYFGGITGANGDPSSIEKSAGTRYGVRRTYWGPSGVSGAVRKVKEDHAAGRVPWISFKLPHNWADMAAGKGDAWVKNLVDRLDALDGPVWLAFHHEPENDSGNIANWTRMQERLGPIVRRRSDNVGFSVIVMGWHQWYGAKHLRIDKMWPDTKVDVSGFDVYNFQGMPDGRGGVRTKWVDFENKYFKVIDAWARKNNTVWGLAETGVSNYSAKRDKTWIRDTYRLMKKYNGVAFSYFNTDLHSKADWTLRMPSKMADFKAALRSSPHLK